MREWSDNDARDKEDHPASDFIFEIPDDRYPECSECQSMIVYTSVAELRLENDSYAQGGNCDVCKRVLDKGDQGFWHCFNPKCEADHCWACTDVKH